MNNWGLASCHLGCRSIDTVIATSLRSGKRLKLERHRGSEASVLRRRDCQIQASWRDFDPSLGFYRSANECRPKKNRQSDFGKVGQRQHLRLRLHGSNCAEMGACNGRHGDRNQDPPVQDRFSSLELSICSFRHLQRVRRSTKGGSGECRRCIAARASRESTRQMSR